MATNSNLRIQKFVHDAARRADLAPALTSAGSSDQPAVTIATEVANAMIRGGPGGQRMNWKWNRLNVIPKPLGVLAAVAGFGTFLTNSWQQDYAVPGVINVDWIEEAPMVNINQVTNGGAPKQVIWLEPKRNLSREYVAAGQALKVCFLPNNLLQYGVWGQSNQFQISGLNNPGPGVVYTYPLGPGLAPLNPINQIVDPNGNLYVLTTYGTCGLVPPTFPGSVVYPTTRNPGLTATTVPDGTCVWTALNPWGQGFRLDSPAPANGVIWLICVTAQMIPPVYLALDDTLGVIPDDMATFFRVGFEAKCVQKNPDPKVRARFTQEWELWQKSLMNAVQSGNREQEDMQFVPGTPIMSGGGSGRGTPAYPFMGGYWGGGN